MFLRHSNIRSGALPKDLEVNVRSYYEGHKHAAGKPNNTQERSPPGPKIDRPFLEFVWTWLVQHPDITLGDQGQFSNITLIEAENSYANKSTIDLTANAAIPEPSLASDLHNKELQAPKTGQDQRSILPGTSLQNEDQPTSSLVPKTARSDIISSSHMADKSAENLAPLTNVRIYASENRMWRALTGHGPDNARVKALDFDLLCLVAARGPRGILQHDLVNRSGQDKRSLPHRADRLAADDYVKKLPIEILVDVDLRFPRAMNTSIIVFRRFADSPEFLCELKRLREPLDSRRSKKEIRRRPPHKKYGTARNVAKVDERGEEANNNVEVASADIAENDAGPALPCQWRPDRPTNNQIFDLVNQSGTQGITLPEIRSILYGHEYKKPIEFCMSKLVDAWQLSQPLHLRHLAVVRDTVLRGKSPVYIHFAFHHFRTLTDQGLASWDAVTTLSSDGRHADLEVDALHQTDEYGFAILHSGAFQGSKNDATLSECAGRYPQAKYKVEGAEPGLGRPPVQRRKQKTRVEVENTEPIDESLIKRETIVRGGRGRPRKHANFDVPPNLATMPMKDIRKAYNSQRMASQYQQKKLTNEIDRRIGLGQNASDVAKEVLQESDDTVRGTGQNPIDTQARASILQKYAGGPPPGQTNFDIALENLGIVKKGKEFSRPRVRRGPGPNKRQPPYLPSIAAHTFHIPPKGKKTSGKVIVGPKRTDVRTRGVKVKIPEELLQRDASEHVGSPFSDEASRDQSTGVQSPALAASQTSSTIPLASQNDHEPTTMDKILKVQPMQLTPAKNNPKALTDRYQKQLEDLSRPHYGFFSAESAMMIRRRKKGDHISLPAIKYKIGVFKLPQLKTGDWMSPTDKSREVSSRSPDALHPHVCGASTPPSSSRTDVTAPVDPIPELVGPESVIQVRSPPSTTPLSTPNLSDPKAGEIGETGASRGDGDFKVRNGRHFYDVTNTAGQKRRRTSLTSPTSERGASPSKKQARLEGLGFPGNTVRSSSVPLVDVSRSSAELQHSPSAMAERNEPQDRDSMNFETPATQSESIVMSASTPQQVDQDDSNAGNVDNTKTPESDPPQEKAASPDEVRIASQTPRDDDQISSQRSLWVSIRVNAEFLKSMSLSGGLCQNQSDPLKGSSNLRTPSRHASAARSPNLDQNPRSGQFRGGGMVAKKIRRTGGTMAMMRKEIVLFLIRKCGGIGPGMPTLALPYAAEWARRGQSGMPERQTVSTAVKALCVAGTLRQLHFAHQSKHGLRKTSSVLTLPDISPSDPRVQRMQNNIIHTWWKNYYPEEWLVQLDEGGRPIITEPEKHGNGNRVPDWTNSEAFHRLLAVTLELRRLAKKKQHDLERLKVLIARDQAFGGRPAHGLGAKRPYHRKTVHMLSKNARKSLLKSGIESPQSQASSSGVFSDLVFQNPTTTAWQKGKFVGARWQSPPPRKPRVKVPPLLSLRRRNRDTREHDQEIDDDEDLEGSSSGSNSDTDSSSVSDDDEFYKDFINEFHLRPETETSRGQYMSPQTDAEQFLLRATGRLATDSHGFPLSQPRLTIPDLQAPSSLPKIPRLAASMRRAIFGLTDPKSLRHPLSGTFGTLYVPTVTKKKNKPRPALPSFMDPKNSMHAPTGTFSASFTGLAFGKKKLSWVSGLPHHVAHSDYDGFKPTHFTYEVDRLKRLELNNPTISAIRFPRWTFIKHVFLHGHTGTFTGKIQTVGWHNFFVSQRSGRLLSSERKRYPNRPNTDIVTLLSTGGARYKHRKLLHSAEGTEAQWDLVKALKRRHRDENSLEVLKQPKWRRIKGPRDSREFTKPEEHRLCIAVVAVRCLTGGVDKQIDWSLVGQVFYPDRSEALLHYKWNVVQAKYRNGLEKLESDFQDAYVKAYAQDTVAPINFDDLEAYDWKCLVAWIGGVISPPAQTIPDDDVVSQGANILQSAETDLSGFYDVDLSLSAHRRLRIFNHGAWTSPLDEKTPDNKPTDSEHILEVAKTWVRATVIAPPETDNPDFAAKTLLSLSEQTIEAAVESLNADKVLAGRRKPSENREQPHFHLHPATMGKLNQAIRPPDLHRAAAFKHYLDTALSDEDQELDFSPHARNGDMIVLLNLLTAGHLTFRPKNIPTNRFGYTDTGYQTRQMNKRNLYCDVAISRTASYVCGNPIRDRLAAVPPPAKHLAPDVVATGEKCRIPIWYDIHNHFVRHMWDLTLAAVISVVVLRPGVGATELEMTFRPMLARWEVEWVFGWLCEVGVGKIVGEEGFVGDEAVRRGRWEVGEWWWLVMPDSSSGKAQMGGGRLGGW